MRTSTSATINSARKGDNSTNGWNGMVSIVYCEKRILTALIIFHSHESNAHYRVRPADYRWSQLGSHGDRWLHGQRLECRESRPRFGIVARESRLPARWSLGASARLLS